MLRSNFLTFSSDSGLKPSPSSFLNPSGSTGDDGLLLLLFSENGLLLPSLKASNPLNRFTPIVLKCRKCSPLIFLIFNVLF